MAFGSSPLLLMARAESPVAIHPQMADLCCYLRPTRVVDWDCPAVRDRAEALVAGHHSDTDRARALYEWVRDAIPHTRDASATW